jgi:hypothetical protein
MSMSSSHVPNSVSIRRSRAHNMSNDRLVRRMNALHGLFANPSSLAHTSLARHRAAELHVIQNILIDRQVVSRNMVDRMRRDAIDRRVPLGDF